MSIMRVVLVGVCGAVVAAFLWVLCALVLPLYIPMWLGTDAGTSAANMGSGSILLAALIGFAVSVVLMRRRARAKLQ